MYVNAERYEPSQIAWQKTLFEGRGIEAAFLPNRETRTGHFASLVASLEQESIWNASDNHPLLDKGTVEGLDWHASLRQSEKREKLWAIFRSAAEGGANIYQPLIEDPRLWGDRTFEEDLARSVASVNTPLLSEVAELFGASDVHVKEVLKKSRFSDTLFSALGALSAAGIELSARHVSMLRLMLQDKELVTKILDISQGNNVVTVAEGDLRALRVGQRVEGVKDQLLFDASLRVAHATWLGMQVEREHLHIERTRIERFGKSHLTDEILMASLKKRSSRFKANSVGPLETMSDSVYREAIRVFEQEPLGQAFLAEFGYFERARVAEVAAVIPVMWEFWKARRALTEQDAFGERTERRQHLYALFEAINAARGPLRESLLNLLQARIAQLSIAEEIPGESIFPEREDIVGGASSFAENAHAGTFSFLEGVNDLPDGMFQILGDDAEEESWPDINLPLYARYEPDVSGFPLTREYGRDTKEMRKNGRISQDLCENPFIEYADYEEIGSGASGTSLALWSPVQPSVAVRVEDEGHLGNHISGVSDAHSWVPPDDEPDFVEVDTPRLKGPGNGFLQKWFRADFIRISGTTFGTSLFALGLLAGSDNPHLGSFEERGATVVPIESANTQTISNLASYRAPETPITIPIISESNYFRTAGGQEVRFAVE